MIATRDHKNLKEEHRRDFKRLCDVVRETAYAIHCYHGQGHLEKIYENALAHRLRMKGIQVAQQEALSVYDEDGSLLGDFYADLVVENVLIVEIKAVRCIVDEHIAQLLGYLKSSGREHGLLVNFGSYKFQIKKFILNASKKMNSQEEEIL